MKPRGSDPIQKARRMMLDAAVLIDQAQRELVAAKRLIERSPGYEPQEGRPYTVAAWIVSSIDATLDSTDNLENAAQLIRADAMPGGAERHLEAANMQDRMEGLVGIAEASRLLRAIPRAA